MSLTTTLRERLEAQLLRYETMLKLAYTSYEELLAENVIEYELDSNEGRQEARNRGLASLTKDIQRIEQMIDSLCRRLAGKGLIAMKSRRKPGGYTRRAVTR